MVTVTIKPVVRAGVACLVLLFVGRSGWINRGLDDSGGSQVNKERNEASPTPALYERAYFSANRTCVGYKSSWCLDTEGTVRYVGTTRAAKQHDDENETFWIPYRTHAGVEQCLANKHVLFIGDSRVRYQLMALLDFLKRRAWMRCEDEAQLAGSAEPNKEVDPSCFLINHEHDEVMQAKDWNEFYNISTSMLQEDNIQQSECDCYRCVPFYPRCTVENRYIRRRSSYGTSHITYLQSFASLLQMHVDQFPPPHPMDVTNVTRCAPGSCSQPHTFYGIPSDLPKILPLFQPTHVIAQAGWKLADISCELEQLATNYPGIANVYMINHMATRFMNVPRAIPALKCPNVTTLIDRQSMTTGIPKFFYWDKVHMLSAANRELNEQLLDHLCGPVNIDDEH